MFGFSTVGLLVTFYVAASALATLLVVAACVASGNSSQASDESFLRRAVEKRGLLEATASTPGSHTLPNTDHRFLPAVEAETEEKLKNESVQPSDEQVTKKERIRA